jgi:ATP-dependent helicase/nuclease subunit B
MNSPSQLTVAIGLTGEPRRELLLRKYRDTLRLAGLGERRQVLWIAPTQGVVKELRDRLALAGGAALLDPGVTTFAGFAAGVVRDGQRPLRPLSTLQRRRVVRQVVARASAEGALNYFAPVAGSAGLVNLVDETIVRLRQRDVSAKQFARQHRRGAPRQRELAGLYAAYEQLLDEQGLIDADGLFRAARDRMEAEPAVATGIRLAVIDGFTQFTPPQLAMLRLLSERAAQVIVTLAGEPGESERTDLFARTIATRAMLVQEFGAAVATEAELASPSGNVMPGSWPALDHLRRNLFRNYRQLEPVSRAVRESLSPIRIIAASSVRAEIEEVGRRVKTLLVAGSAPSDIVVAFRSTFDVADRVRQTFDDFGIPFYIDASRRLNATPLVRSLVNALRLEVENWPYRRMLHVVGDRSITWWDATEPKSGLTKSGDRPGGSTRGAVEWLIRQGQLPEGREELLALLGEFPAAAEPDLTEARAPSIEANADGARHGMAQRDLFHDSDDDPFGDGSPSAQTARGPSRLLLELDDRGYDGTAAAARLRGFADLLGGLPRHATISRWVVAVEKFAKQLGLFDAPHVASHGRQSADEAFFQPRREWAILEEGLHAAEHVDDWAAAERTKLSLSDFVELLTTTAAELPSPESRDATGRVQVLSAENMRHLRPRHLFLGGLSEQAFPAGRGVTNDATSDADAEPAESPADARSDEMLLFYETVTSPTESLTLSYPALDAKAQPLPAGPFLVELERAFGDAEIETTRQPLSYEHQHGDVPLSRSDVRRHAVLRAHDTRGRTPDVKLLASLASSPLLGETGRAIVDGIRAVAGRSDRKIFSEFEGVLLSEAARARLATQYGPDYIWSPSRLETYAACPYRFFGEHMLRLEPLPELALESDLARRGSLLHDTLAKLYGVINELADAGKKASAAEVAENFQQMLDRVVGQRPRRGLDHALVEIERRQIAAWAEQFARQHDEYAAAWPHLDGELKATYFEARFGPKNRRSESTDDAVLSTDQAFELQLRGEPIRFTGQIDRIDVAQVGGVTVFNVIDYKTSAKHRVDVEKMKAGTQLQLPLYALAVAELLLAEQEAVGLSAGYWSIRGKGFAAGAKQGGPLTLSEIERGVVREAAHWPELKSALLERIREIVIGIRSGWFPVYNEDKDCGQFCPLNTGCRIAHVRSLEKRWLPPVEVER